MSNLNFEPQPEMMRQAIQAVQRSMENGQGGPFGACIVRDGQVLAAAGNRVLSSHDPSAHAEVCAIREACAALQTHLLTGATLYSTTEPCPMCFSAIHWAQIETIVYGTSIDDVHRLGFNELTISNQQMKTLGGSPVRLFPTFLQPECLELLERWKNLATKQVY